jgi:hypothetical protein
VSSSGFAVQAVSDLEVSKTRGLRCPRFTELEAPRALLGSLAPKLSGVEVLEALRGVGGRVLGVEVFGALRGSWHRYSREEALDVLSSIER